MDSKEHFIIGNETGRCLDLAHDSIFPTYPSGVAYFPGRAQAEKGSVREGGVEILHRFFDPLLQFSVRECAPRQLDRK